MFDEWVERADEVLRDLSSAPVARDEATALARVEAFERLRNALVAVQARETVAARELREDAERCAGVPAEKRCRGFASEVALALRESPARGSRFVGLARALVEDMPHTLAAVTRSEVSSWRATVLARETAWLSREDRARVDEALAPRMVGLSTSRLEREARVLAQSLDARGAVAHLARKEGERCVTLRPAPDAMVYLSALLPMKAGVGAYATLERDAKSLIATGGAGDRSRGQVMADLLVERITGVDSPSKIPVEVHVLMTDQTLFGPAAENGPTGTDAHVGGPPSRPASETPGWFVGHGPVPAEAARNSSASSGHRVPGGDDAWHVGGSNVHKNSSSVQLKGGIRDRFRKGTHSYSIFPARQALPAQGATGSFRSVSRKYVLSLVVMDLVIGLISFAVIVQVIDRLLLPGDVFSYLAALLAAGAWPLLIAATGGYRRRRIGVGTGELRSVFGAGPALLALSVYPAAMLSQWSLLTVVALTAPLCVTVSTLGRFVARDRLHRLQKRGVGMRRTLAVGSPDAVAALRDAVAREPFSGMTVIAACLPVGTEPDGLGIPVVGGLNDVRAVVMHGGYEAVAVTGGEYLRESYLRRLAWSLEDVDVKLLVAPGLAEVVHSRLDIKPVVGMPLLEVEQPKFTGWQHTIKRALDIVLTL